MKNTILVLLISLFLVSINSAGLRSGQLTLTNQPVGNSTIASSAVSPANPIVPATTSEVFQKSPEPTIQVTGSAAGNVETDLVQISIELDSRNSTASAALSQNTISSSATIKSISNFNVPAANITTTSFTFGPEYNYTYTDTTTTKVFVDYLATNVLQIELSDLTNAGNVIDAASKIPDASVTGVNFVVSNQKQLDAENALIAEAVDDATNKATLTLNAANYKIKGIQSIVLNNQGSTISPSPVFALAESSAAVPAPTLYANSQAINMGVTVTFTIEAM